MNLISSIVIALGIYQLPYIQAELSIVSFDVDCPTVNPEYFSNVEIYLLDEGRDNEYFVNFTLIKTFPPGTQTHFKMIGATMGEYKVPTGFDIAMPSCASVSEPIIGNRIFESLGIKSCPVQPGTYSSSKLTVIETATLPDTFPANKYVAEFSAKLEDEIFFYCRNFFEIQ
ncbi:uncharacterized protein [Chelonus insularis]|uniref:uncharacterized protein n=1 Tax=Chelonus insularis TaxID=460826 RepID=UPI00158BEBBA|nr:uncharacterized protein LOC118072259 [Chelonus insularis]